MLDNILLTTTPVVEGMQIEKYFGIVSSNQVAGTGFLTDFMASFSDIFGGNSGAYRESMNELFRDVTKNIKIKASELGANAIVGVSIDYDNISAKSMSMFMISIQGTAVKLKNPNDNTDSIPANEISWETLNLEYNKKRILDRLNGDKILDEKEWAFIFKYNLPEWGESFFYYYLKCLNSVSSEVQSSEDLDSISQQGPMRLKQEISNYKQYLGSLNYEDAIKYVYRNVGNFRDIIEKKKLFNASKILEIAKQGELSTAISLLSFEKSSYNENDLSEMQALCEYLDNLPEAGKKEEVKGGLFSSGGLKYVCVCGCKNEVGTEYCTKCGRNIYGITKEEVQSIENFKGLVNTLSALLQKRNS